MKNYLIVALLFITSPAFSSAQSVKFPNPTGPYTVGCKDLEFADESRDDPYNPGHHRRMKVTVYYPSSDSPKLEPYGAEEVMFWQREMKEPLEVGDITMEEIQLIVDELKRTHVAKARDATSAAGSFPVIVSDHGLGVTAGSYQSILLELASYGYVIVAPGHPAIADTVIFADGTEVLFKAEKDAKMFNTALQDTQFVLEKIDEIVAFIPSVDPTTIGMMGHSLGGYTTIKLTRVNPRRIKAGISLDAPVSHETYDYDDGKRTIKRLDSNIDLDNGSEFGTPFLHIFADKPMCDPSVVRLNHNTLKAVIKGTEHNSFADHSVLKDMISVFKEKGWHLGAGDTEARLYQPEMIKLIRLFFDKFLKDVPVDLMQLNTDVVAIEIG